MVLSLHLDGAIGLLVPRQRLPVDPLQQQLPRDERKGLASRIRSYVDCFHRQERAGQGGGKLEVGTLKFEKRP